MKYKLLPPILIAILFFGLNDIKAALPEPSHSMWFGYYHVDSQYGDFKSEIKDYTNAQIILQESFIRADLNEEQKLKDALKETADLGHTLIYAISPAQSLWDKGIEVATPYWNNIDYIYLADEPNWTRTETEQNINLFNSKLQARGLGTKQIIINYTPNQLKSGTSFQANNIDVVGFEAYIDPGYQDNSNLIDTLKAQIAESQSLIGNRKQMIVIQGYDRNGAWKNITSLKSIQDVAYTASYDDPNVVGLLVFSYARPGGSKGYPTLKEAHREIGAAITGQEYSGGSESNSTTTKESDATAGWGGNLAYNSANNTWLVVSAGANGVSGRIMNNNGTSRGEAFDIDGSPSGGAPRTVYTPGANKYLVIWGQTATGVDGYDIYGRFIGPEGQLMGNPFNITPDDPRQVSGFSTVYDGRNKKYLVTYNSFVPKGAYDIYLKTLNLDGSGGNLVPITTQGSGRSAASIAVNEKSNEYCLSFQNYSPEQPNPKTSTSSSLSVKKIDAGTLQVGPEKFVSNDMWFQGGIVYNSVDDEYFVNWSNAQIDTGLGRTLKGCDPATANEQEDQDVSLYGMPAYNPKSNTYAIVSHDCCSEKNVYITLDSSLNNVGDGYVFLDSKSGIGNFAPQVAANTTDGKFAATSSDGYTNTRFVSNISPGTSSSSALINPRFPRIPTDGLIDLGGLISLIFSWSLGLLGLAVFFVIFISGVKIFTAGGNMSKVNEARDRIKDAAIGAVILLAAYLILYTINPDLVGGSIRLPPVPGPNTTQTSTSTATPIFTPPANFPNLKSDVQTERNKYGSKPSPEELGKILNAVAWKNKDTGWGLSRKSSGENCPSPVGLIACDILHHQPTNILVDVLYAAGEAATPAWEPLGYASEASRPWVAPVAPSN